MQELTIQRLLEAGVHFGHQTRYRNPKMQNYIFGTRNKINIINLDKTLPLFKDALNFISKLAAKKGKILFVGTKSQAGKIIKEEAKRCDMPYVDYRWLGGTLTNYKTIKQSIKRLKDLDEMRNSPVINKLTKKEILLLDREIEKLERNLGGIKDMKGLPDALFILDTGHEKIAVNEARKLHIPIIAIIDTNHNPDEITYPIPGNDDAISAIKFYTQNIADVIVEARSHIIEEIQAEEKLEKAPKRPVKPKKKVVTKPIKAKEPLEAEKEPEPTAETAKKTKKVVVKKAASTKTAKPKTTKKTTTTTKKATNKTKDTQESTSKGEE